MNFPLTISYNMEDKKVGCVLLQGITGGELSGGDISRHFHSNAWELSPKKLKLFTINNQEEFDKVVEITNKAHKKDEHKTV